MSATRNLSAFSTDQTLIAPSILAADFSCLGKDVATVEKDGAELLHIDIMDAHFVPNLSMGPGVVQCIRPHSDLLFDVHLMQTDPKDYVEPFAKAGADHITFHTECGNPIDMVIRKILDLGMTAGLSVKPGTPIEDVFPYLDQLAMVLIMTVEPGFGGQSFMEDMLPKITRLRNEIIRRKLAVHIEVDGGINAETSMLCREAGANAIVAGTSIFRAPEGTAEAIRLIRG